MGKMLVMKSEDLRSDPRTQVKLDAPERICNPSAARMRCGVETEDP